MEGMMSEEYEQLLDMLEKYEAAGNSRLGPIPEELQELMANVKRAKGQQAAAQQESTQEVTPQPGYVIKTADSQQRKVFINVCHSSKVPAPSSWADGLAPEKVLKALEDMQQSQPNTDAEAMRFAISVSELQPDTDKQGHACVTVDCMINSDVMKAVQQSRPLKAFVNELAVDYVSTKHKLELDQKYKLPKMSYKGAEVRSQRVKLDPKQLVSDVTSIRDIDDEPSFPLLPSKAAAVAAKKAKAATAAAAGTNSKPGAAAAAAGPAAAAAVGAGSGGRVGSSSSSSWQHEVKCEGRPVTHMAVVVQLPAALSSSSSWSPEAVQVQLCGRQLKVVVVPQQQQQQQQEQEPTAMCIHLPFAASHVGAQADLQGSNGQLTVRLPYLPLQQWVQQLEQEAPTAFSRLPVSHESYMELDE